MCRFCRRLGQSVCYTEKCAVHRKPSPPGIHGKASKQLSEYGRQLREKQKARWTFGLTESAMRKYAAVSRRAAGASADNLLIELERRLDNVVFRSGFAETPRMARQMASHGHFLVNGRRMNVPSFRVSLGDTIQVRPKLQKSALYMKVSQEVKPPRWLVVDRENLKITVEALPDAEDVASTAIDSRLVTEYYSR
jgi:small subunit ribosomal protein S4